jgi:integrase
MSGSVRQRGSVYRVRGGWGIRWREDGRWRGASGPWATKTQAREWFAASVLPRLRGDVEPEAETAGEITFDAFADLYLEAHAANISPRSLAMLTTRLRPARKAFGSLTLRELEPLAAEVAAWRVGLPERARYGYTAAFRQTLAAAVRWGRASQNPVALSGPNEQPRREEVVPFTQDEINSIVAELGSQDGALVVVVVETGLRPGELVALERRDVDREGRVLRVERVFSAGQVRPYPKTERSRRRVPLWGRAQEALDSLPPRIDTPAVFPSRNGDGYMDWHNWRARSWEPALRAAGLYACPGCGEPLQAVQGARGRRRCEPCGIGKATRQPYTMRHTFASTALAAGLSVFELARVMGTSVQLIDATYGHLVKGSDDAIRERLDRYASESGS